MSFTERWFLVQKLSEKTVQWNFLKWVISCLWMLELSLQLHLILIFKWTQKGKQWAHASNLFEHHFKCAFLLFVCICPSNKRCSPRFHHRGRLSALKGGARWRQSTFPHCFISVKRAKTARTMEPVCSCQSGMENERGGALSRNTASAL